MAKMQELAKLGQSIWFDYIQRSIITSGKLQELIDQGLRGITSNPAIFEKAIAGSSDYDGELQALIEEDRSVEEIYEALAVRDIGLATDLMKPVYDATECVDGFVSLEVNPGLAQDTEGTIAEARRLFETLGRPNVMIKVPATPAGIPAVRQLIGSGVNINVTLMFALDNYREVAEAHLQGLEMLAQNGPSVSGGLTVDKVASVASFFVSRVDTAVDSALGSIGNESLQGKIAIANAKVTYAAFEEVYSGARWDTLRNKGARVQRPLWASTGTKNPLYPDTLYVDELIGPFTVNTLPPATLDSFVDHGTVAQTLTEGIDEARSQLAELSNLGIDLDAITQKLQDDGVAAFADAFDSLMASISEKQDRLVVEK